jgi:hypothetical protein
MLLADTENQDDEVEVACEDGDELPEPPAQLTDADLRGCRFISGSPTPLRASMFCCKPALRGWSWCSEHYHVVFPRKSPARKGAGR